jgi:hypothetical protein
MRWYRSDCIASRYDLRKGLHSGVRCLDGMAFANLAHAVSQMDLSRRDFLRVSAGAGGAAEPAQRRHPLPQGRRHLPTARQSESADESLTPCSRRHRLGGLGSRARVAELTKKTRDETFVERPSDGRLVNMTPAIFSLEHAPDGSDQTTAPARARAFGTRPEPLQDLREHQHEQHAVEERNHPPRRRRAPRRGHPRRG